MIFNGAKLAVASVARATPLFLPHPKIIYINVLHYSAPPELIHYVQHHLYAPIGAIAHCPSLVESGQISGGILTQFIPISKALSDIKEKWILMFAFLCLESHLDETLIITEIRIIGLWWFSINNQ